MKRYHLSDFVALTCAVVAAGTAATISLPAVLARRDDPVKYSGNTPSVKGSGNIRQETRSVSDFHAVETSGAAELSLQQGATESLKIESEDNILPLIESRVENGVLHLGLRSNTSVSTKHLIRYTVSVRNLDSLKLSGTVRVTVPEVRTSGRFTLDLTGATRVDIPSLNADSLDADLTGAARVKLSGSAASQELRLTGASRFDAGGFTTNKTHAVLAGAARARVHATQKLDVVASGTSSVSYTGSPEVTRNTSGVSSVRPATR